MAGGNRDGNDWRNELKPDARPIIVSQIMDVLNRCIPNSGVEGLVMIRKMALGLEEPIYSKATNQEEYLQKISLEMQKLITQYTGGSTSLQLHFFGGTQNLPCPGAMNDVNGRLAQSEPIGDRNDWRTHMQDGARERIINMIMDTLMRHLPISGPGRLDETKKLAKRFEGNIYSTATSESEYTRKIALKMLSMERKKAGGATTSNPQNSSVGTQKTIDPGNN